jgi:transcriptional regulator with XRE-family HTH domain
MLTSLTGFEMRKIGMNANNLLNYLITQFKLKNDAALAREMKISAPIISKLRNGHSNLTAVLLVAIHEQFDISIRDLRFLAGDFREHTRPSAEILNADALKKMGFTVESPIQATNNYLRPRSYSKNRENRSAGAVNGL